MSSIYSLVLYDGDTMSHREFFVGCEDFPTKELFRVAIEAKYKRDLELCESEAKTLGHSKKLVETLRASIYRSIAHAFDELNSIDTWPTEIVVGEQWNTRTKKENVVTINHVFITHEKESIPANQITPS